MLEIERALQFKVGPHDRTVGFLNRRWPGKLQTRTGVLSRKLWRLLREGGQRDDVDQEDGKTRNPNNVQLFHHLIHRKTPEKGTDNFTRGLKQPKGYSERDLCAARNAARCQTVANSAGLRDSSRPSVRTRWPEMIAATSSHSDSVRVSCGRE